jgi:hypothetical protein
MSTFREFIDQLFKNKELKPCVATITVDYNDRLLYGFTMNIHENSYDYTVPFLDSEIKENTKICIVTYTDYIYSVYKNNLWQKELL